MTAPTRKKARYADHAIVRFVRSLPDEYYLPREVADLLDVSPTMLSWLPAKYPEDELGPTHQAAYGKIKLRLYTPERVRNIRRHLDEHGTGCGRPRLFSQAEELTRRRQIYAERSYRKTVAKAEAAGETEKAAVALAKADAIREKLESSRVKRCQELNVSHSYRAVNAAYIDVMAWEGIS